jgi:hypothetical protein
LGKLLTAQEVASGPLQGKKSAKYVLAQAKTGKLASLRLSERTILFDEDDVARWLQGTRAPSTSEPVAS